MKKSSLKEIRNSLGLVQKQMGTILNVSQQQYGKFERNINEMKENHIIRLYEQLDISPTWLLLQIGPKKISDLYVIKDEDEQIESKRYVFNYNVDKTIQIVKDAHTLSSTFHNEMNKALIESILQKKMRNLENIHIYLFCKILSQISKSTLIKTTYKKYFINRIEKFETDIFYRKKQTKSLISFVESLDELSCSYLVKNIHISIEKAHLNIDITTRFIDTFLPISKVQNFIQPKIFRRNSA